MMKKMKYLLLCAMIVAATLFTTACGNNKDGDNNMNETQAPYEDEVEKNDGSLKKAGENLKDSVEETGDALRNGVDDLMNGEDNTDNTNGANDNGTVNEIR